ncbi:hypothetical protein [Aliarcobacter skirrowii]|uniref:hypothetical protein n=1 Tax=Aliarcobacter skirrowii TaxID=28200 RepID=UPI0008345B96|nr:hypothetical protein [Aliarcobacter skirrowii]
MFKKILMSLFISNLLLAEDINIKIEEGEEFNTYQNFTPPNAASGNFLLNVDITDNLDIYLIKPNLLSNIFYNVEGQNRSSFVDFFGNQILNIVKCNPKMYQSAVEKCTTL